MSIWGGGGVCACGSGILSSAEDVLEMSVVLGVRGVFGVCELCGVRGLVGARLGPSYLHGRVGGVVSVCVVSLDYLCRWLDQVSIYCARRLPAQLRCTLRSILLHLIDI